MNYKLKFALLALISNALAAKFSVVSFDGECKLNVGGTAYDMAPDTAVPFLYHADAPVKAGTKYNYVCGGKNDVERTLNGENTFNELVGRVNTITDMPEFGYPNNDPWTRSIGRGELFDQTYVPIIIVDGSKDFFVKAGHASSFNKVYFVCKDSAYGFDNVKIAETKNDEEKKFQFTINLPNEGINHRDVFKFRPSSTDLSFIRQMLYGDIAHAIGNPAHESVAARVYLKDGTGIGLYVLQEDVTSESFIRTAFFGNKDGSIKQYTPTPIYDCSTGADFNENDPHQLGGFQNHQNEADPKIELLEAIRKINHADVSDLEQIRDIDENWLDLDTLFKALALEYLTGHWDSFWFLTSNFVTYHPYDETEGEIYVDLKKYKYYFIDQDFDQTWSIGLADKFAKLPTTPYTDYVNKDEKFWKSSDDAGTRVIINKFLGCDGKPSCHTKDVFEEHLKNIVKFVFNPVAIGKKVDGYRARLDEEMKCDHSFPRLHTGTEGKMDQYDTYEFYDRSFSEGVNFSHTILGWTTLMADNVCKQFGFEYNTEPITPDTAQNMEAGKTMSGSMKTNVSSTFTIFIATLVAILLF